MGNAQKPMYVMENRCRLWPAEGWEGPINMDRAAECNMRAHGSKIFTKDHRAAELAEAFEHSSSPMWVFDIHTLAFLAVNDAAVQQYGYSRAQFLAMTILDIRPIEDIAPLLRAQFRGGRHDSDHELWRHRKKDGRVIKVEINSRELIFDGLEAEIVIAREINPQTVIHDVC